MKPTATRLVQSLLLVAGLFAASIFALSQGAFSIQWSGILDNQTSHHAVFWSIRLPRALLTILVGASLGVCGAAMQGLFRNPLADPSLIGISSGAALGASATIVFAQHLRTIIELPEAISLSLTPLMAFLVGLLVTLVLYQLSSQKGKTNIAILLLAGVAIQAITGAGIGLLTYLADNNELRDLTFWSMGSFNAANWTAVKITSLCVVPSLLLLLTQSKALNAFMIGEQNAFYLGIRVERTKRIIIILTALTIGIVVSVSGIIGFIGLVVPHLIRLLVGANHNFLLPFSALFGAILLLLADTLARTVIAPAELPIGIITALIGGPFFLYLLIKQRRQLLL
ncbi:MAG: iron chelate uptake ABC transporter family permease subunit [Pseudomonadota bacterium]|nr:iron chelate uptake ABC transporter family permease subunit [Pseudomonadota bacterium]